MRVHRTGTFKGGPREAHGEWARGWRTLLAAFFAMGTGWNSAMNASGLFLKSMQADFGWSRTQLSLGAVGGFLFALLLPVTGVLLDRFGARRIAIVGILGMAAAFALLAAVPPKQVLFYAAVGALALAGAVNNSIVLGRGVSLWFRDSLGTAIGLMTTGASLSGAIMIPVLSQVIAAHGWRTGFLTQALITVLVIFPLVFLWFREPSLPGVDSTTTPQVPDPLSSIARTRQFWQLTIACGLAAFPIGGFIGHLIPLLTDGGLPAQIAARYGALFAIAIGFGRIANGALLDRLHAPRVTATTLLLAAGGSALLYACRPNFATMAPVLLVAATIMIGLAQGAEGDYIAVFSVRLFGLRNFARVVSIMGMVISLGMALGGLLFARVVDLFGTYEPAVLGSIAMYAAGALVFLSMSMDPPLRVAANV